MTEPGSSVSIGAGASVNESVIAGRDVIIARDHDPARRPNDTCPYLGLEPFSERDRYLLFGRAREIAELRRRVESSNPFTALTGASGVGKTSLIQAGLVPLIRAGGLEPVTVDLHDAVDQLSTIADSSLVVIIDQVEQMFSPDVATAEAAKAIVELADHGRVRHVLVSFRSDYQPAFDSTPELQALIDSSLVRVAPIGPDHWREIIERPATSVGLTLEPGLVELIERDIPPTATALPLLSVALRATWERRYNRRLEIRGYRESGGVAAALEEQAERAYRGLSPEQRVLAQWMYAMRLTYEGGGLEPTRRRATMEELSASSLGPAEPVVDAFRNARLLSVSGELSDPETSVEIVHETLLRAWPRLADDWLKVKRPEIRRLQSWIAESTHVWQSAQRDPSALRTGPMLQQAVEAVEQRTLELTDDEVVFVHESARAQVEAETREFRTKKLRRLALITGAVACLLAAVAVVSVSRERRERALRTETQALRTTADALALAESQPDAAVLVALEGLRHSPSTETWSALVEVLGRPGPAAFIRSPETGSVSAIATIELDGREAIAVVDGSATVRFVSPTTGREARAPITTETVLNDLLAASPSGAILVTGSRAGQLVAYETAVGSSTSLPYSSTDRLLQVDVVGDRIVATNEAGELIVWALDGTVDQVGTPFDGDVITAMAAMSQSTLALGSERGGLVLWSLDEHLVVSDLVDLGPNLVVDVAVDETGQVAAVGTNTIAIWDGRSEPRRISTSVSSVSWMNPELLTIGRPNGEVVGIAVASGTVVGSPRLGHGSLVRRVSSFAGGGAVSLDEAGVAIAWSPPEQSALANVTREDIFIGGVATEAGSAPVAIEFPLTMQRDGDRSLVLDPTSGLLTETGSIVLEVPAGRRATESASNGSGVLAIGLDNGDVLIQRGSTDMKLHVDGEVRGLDVSGDGRYVAVSAVNAADLDDAPPVSLFDLSSGEHGELTGHSLFVDALRFSPNGRLLAGGSDDRGIHLWDSGSAEEVDVLSGHNDLISTLVWADDRILVSGAQDATVRIWDAMTGESVGGALVSGHADDVTQVDLDDDHIVAAQGNYLVTWEFGARAWIARACDAVARPLTAAEWSEFFDRQQVDSCAALRDSPPVFVS